MSSKKNSWYYWKFFVNICLQLFSERLFKVNICCVQSWEKTNTRSMIKGRLSEIINAHLYLWKPLIFSLLIGFLKRLVAYTFLVFGFFLLLTFFCFHPTSWLEINFFLYFLDFSLKCWFYIFLNLLLCFRIFKFVVFINCTLQLLLDLNKHNLKGSVGYRYTETNWETEETTCCIAVENRLYNVYWSI